MAVASNLIGATIGGYEIIEPLGSGGMGTVYRAYQATLDREVGFKILSIVLSDVEDHVQRFFREAKTAASLEHPNIVPVYDFGTIDGLNYVVMRLLSGGTLEKWSSRDDGRLPSLKQVSRLLNQLAGALDYAHSHGVVHRDIKDKNIMFDEHNMPFLVDFGIAKLTEGTALTQTGMIVGTPSHMAPELWSTAGVFPQTDQYALAVVIYQLLTGKLPFEGDNPLVYMNQHLRQVPPSPRMIRPELPAAINPVMSRALAKDPTDRYSTTSDFAQAFAAAIAPGASDAAQLPTPRKPKTRSRSSNGATPRQAGPRQSLSERSVNERANNLSMRRIEAEPTPVGQKTAVEPEPEKETTEPNFIVKATTSLLGYSFRAIFKLAFAFAFISFLFMITFNFFDQGTMDIGIALERTLDQVLGIFD